jgi:class 3 adenylate cyclase
MHGDRTALDVRATRIAGRDRAKSARPLAAMTRDRRLAAILVADVVGYSRLMGAAGHAGAS